MVIQTRAHTRRSVSEATTDQPSSSNFASQNASRPVITEAAIQARLNAQDTYSNVSSPFSSPLSSISSPASISKSDETRASPSESEDLAFEPEYPESETSSQHDDAGDDLYSAPPRKTPLSRLRVYDIEDELNVTRSQGDQLHDLMQAEMKSAGLLGEMNFSPAHKQGNENALKPIFAAVKENLPFLEAASVPRVRLGELLWARAMILNQHEKHNRWMVRRGHVKMRADGTTYAVGEDSGREGLEQSDARQQDEVGDAPRLAESELPALRRSSRGARPSVTPADLGSMDFGNGLYAAQGDGGQRQLTPGSPIHVDESMSETADEPASTDTSPKPTTTGVFHPSAFIVRVVRRTTGAAVHTSQLLTDVQRNANVLVESLSYETFITLVSKQVGLDVRGRISGVVPKFHNIAPIDMTVLIGEEATWRAVLQAWQNTRRRTCEFVVKAD